MSELVKCPGSDQPATPTQQVEHHDGGIVVTDDSGAVVSATTADAAHCPTCSALVRVVDGTIAAHDWVPPES